MLELPGGRADENRPCFKRSPPEVLHLREDVDAEQVALLLANTPDYVGYPIDAEYSRSPP